MNREDIIRMARDVGLIGKPIFIEGLEHFATLVASAAQAKEREACAQIADQMTQHSYLGKVGQAIRARVREKV